VGLESQYADKGSGNAVGTTGQDDLVKTPQNVSLGTTGAQYGITSSNYTAVITEEGATVRQLRFRARDLIVGFTAEEEVPDYRGALVAPWPNRIAGGRYTYEGRQLQLPVNEPKRDAALHGLVCEQPWTLVSSEPSGIRLRHAIRPSAGYPFSVLLEVTYRLDDAGFHTEVSATNTGDHTAPYGICPHPYLMAGKSALDSWRLELAADTFLEVTPDRLQPLGRRPVNDGPFDFRRSRELGDVQIDHAFTDIERDPQGNATVRLTDAGGTGVGIRWDRSCDWVQIHTADHPDSERHRLGLAVEPMSCPPDAFNSGEDVVHLPAGATHIASWSIFAI
jgi:aldose 1-epimerase